MKNTLFLLLCMILYSACGTDSSTKEQTDTQPMTEQKVSSKVQVNTASSSTQDNKRMLKKGTFPGPNPIEANFLTNNNWSVSGAYTSDAERKKRFSNKTFEFMTDGKFYVYDSTATELARGVFFLDMPHAILKLYPRPNDYGFDVSEWNFQINGSQMVITGTPTHGDNGLIVLLGKVEKE